MALARVPAEEVLMGRALARPGNVRRMMWLMPRTAKTVPYLGYIVVAAGNPA